MRLLAPLVLLTACQSPLPSQPRPDAGAAPSPLLDARRDTLLHPDALVRRSGARPGMVVADLGAGPGYLTLPLARAVGPTGRVIATDVDHAALTALAERARGAKLFTIETRTVGSDEPGLSVASVDLALLVEVAPFLPHLTDWLVALAPSLRPGARLMVVGWRNGREGLLAAATRAGYRLVDEDRELAPTHYVVFLAPARDAGP